jgi:glycosyltransferase involved in cell wall biosynthesis
MHNALVTVFIPTFNRLSWLQRAVASVLSQGDFVRLHVLDNASPDGTAEWLRELANHDGRVQLTLRSQNVGGLKNFSDGFHSVETPYLVPLSDDDELASGFLASALEIAEADPELGAVVFTTEVRKAGKTVAFSPPPGTQEGRVEPAEHLLRWAEHGHYIAWSSILWRKDPIFSFASAATFQKFQNISDLWIQFLVFLEVPVVVCNQAGSIFNEHDGQTSQGVGPHTINELGVIVREMSLRLDQTRTLDQTQKDKFLEKISLFFNNVLYYRSNAGSLDAGEKELCLWIENYIKYLFPYAGFSKFPFLCFFEEHKFLKARVKELEKQISFQQQHGHSLKAQFRQILGTIKRRVLSKISQYKAAC